MKKKCLSIILIAYLLPVVCAGQTISILNQLKEKYSYVSNQGDYFVVGSETKKGICDSLGKLIIVPAYTEIFKVRGYYENLFSTKIGNKEGLCDLSGKIIFFPNKYTDIYREDSYYYVKIGDKVGACDLKGNEVVPCNFADIRYDFYKKKLQIKYHKEDTNFVAYKTYVPI